MINTDMLSTASQQEIRKFNDRLVRYWRSNVKKYFNKRESEYGLAPKLNHRFLFSPYSGRKSPRLQNAIEVNWHPESNHIRVNVVPIMVRSVTIGKYVQKGATTADGSFVVKKKDNTRAYDLIRLLGENQRPTSPGAWIASIDRRVTGGERRAHNPAVWSKWFSSFTTQIDQELEKLATSIEKHVVEEF